MTVVESTGRFIPGFSDIFRSARINRPRETVSAGRDQMAASLAVPS
ncbi:MAG: hypothetical protein AB2693_06565 [Candidatus Thiodiazotropha sp.]